MRQDRLEATSGDNARVAERRRTQALRDAAAARQRIKILQPLTMALPSTALPDGRPLWRSPDRAALTRFMFRTDAALQIVSTLSGGRILRAGLACVRGSPKPPQLPVLDEPTNHLDMDSIGTVESGRRTYDGALLVVSQDDPSLAAIGNARRRALPPSPKPRPAEHASFARLRSRSLWSG